MLLELIKAVIFLVDSIENSPILPFYCVLLTAKKKKKQDAEMASTWVSIRPFSNWAPIAVSVRSRSPKQKIMR